MVDLCQCQNGATCTPEGECLCPTGFAGLHCETNVDDCAHHPCRNGATCVDGLNTFRCQCVPGYVGPHCEDEVDYCLAKPCANGGICSNRVNDYKCACKPGFTGKDCSVDIDECAPRPCKNGGKCVDRVNGFLCTCKKGYVGATCADEPGGRAGNISRQVLAREDSGLSAEHIVVIATLSVAIPLIVLIAAVVVVCLKQRRALERRKADEEARRQNEQNSVSSAVVSKRTDAHMIKNTWSAKKKEDVSESWDPVYTLHRTRSQKQLNTELGRHRSSKELGGSELAAPPTKRISLMSLDSNHPPPPNIHCHSR